MERRTLLTALAAAPLAALASTANALGRRRRQCYDQPSHSGGVSKGLAHPSLTLTLETVMAGMMPTYTVKITADVTAVFVPGSIEEVVQTVNAKLMDSSGTAVAGFEDEPMSLDTTVSIPPAKRFKLERTGVMLIPSQQYLAYVTVTIEKKEYGLSTPATAQSP